MLAFLSSFCPCDCLLCTKIQIVSRVHIPSHFMPFWLWRNFSLDLSHLSPLLRKMRGKKVNRATTKRASASRTYPLNYEPHERLRGPLAPVARGPGVQGQARGAGRAVSAPRGSRSGSSRGTTARRSRERKSFGFCAKRSVH